jgi:hypothetical protein
MAMGKRKLITTENTPQLHGTYNEYGYQLHSSFAGETYTFRKAGNFTLESSAIISDLSARWVMTLEEIRDMAQGELDIAWEESVWSNVKSPEMVYVPVKLMVIEVDQKVVSVVNAEGTGFENQYITNCKITTPEGREHYYSGLNRHLGKLERLGYTRLADQDNKIFYTKIDGTKFHHSLVEQFCK